MRPLIFLLVGFVGVSASGCAALSSYNRTITPVIGHMQTGNLAAARETLQQNSDESLLFYMEQGSIAQLEGKIEDSSASWLKADQKLLEFEEQAKITLGKTGGAVASVLLNDKFTDFYGADYEKVMLSTLLALNHAIAGKWADARVEVRKTNEREEIIRELREIEYREAEEQSAKSKFSTRVETIRGYPVEIFDSPEVKALKNSYQNALTHYLAGFVYEALGEKDNAATGYRKAMELRPELTLPRRGLEGLDSPPAAEEGRATSDVLIVIASGFVPAKTSLMIPIPVPRAGVVSISFPTLSRQAMSGAATGVRADGAEVTAGERIANVDAMARRELADQMPAIITRSIIRAMLKGGIQYAAYREGGTLVGLGVNIFNVLTESSDERTWRTLPAEFHVARLTLNAGNHRLAVGLLRPDRSFEPLRELIIDTAPGSRNIVLVRFLGSGSVVVLGPKGQVPADGRMMAGIVHGDAPGRALPMATAAYAGAAAPDLTQNRVVELGKMRYLAVTSLQVRQQGPFLQVQSTIQNNDRNPQQLYYRVEWFDADGFRVGEEAWKAEWVQAKATKLIQHLAPTPQIRDFKLYVNSPENWDPGTVPPATVSPESETQ